MSKKQRKRYENQVNQLIVEFLESSHSPLGKEEMSRVRRAAEKTVQIVATGLDESVV